MSGNRGGRIGRGVLGAACGAAAAAVLVAVGMAFFGTTGAGPMGRLIGALREGSEASPLTSLSMADRYFDSALTFLWLVVWPIAGALGGAVAGRIARGGSSLWALAGGAPAVVLWVASALPIGAAAVGAAGSLVVSALAGYATSGGPKRSVAQC